MTVGEDSTDGDDGDVEEAREIVIDAMARSSEMYGLNRSYGRLYGILWFADEPLSLDELVERSGYAKSTVSTAMQSLERFHVVHRRSVPGTGKRSHYEAETDFYHIISELLEQQGKREIRVMNRALDEAAEKLEAADDDRAAADLAAVRDLQRTYDKLETLMHLLSRLPVDRIVSLLKRVSEDEEY